MAKSASPRTDRIAENLFERKCLDEGCTVNRVGDDQNGWDFIVEFPPLAHDGPVDTRPPALSCLVQIKSTQTESATVRIKLSNALKFAKNPLPCFTVLIVFSADGKTPSRYYLQHFHHDQITQALKSARQAHGSTSAAPNRKTIPLRFGPEDVTAENDLVNRIARSVPNPSDYSALKSEFYRKVGYENGYGQGKITFASEHSAAFVDALLGKKSPVPVQRIFFHEERFGIANPKAVFDGPGTIHITPEPRTDCRVVLRPPGGSEQIVLSGKVFAPGIPNLPDEFRKIRIETDILEFTCGAGTGREVKFGDFSASFRTKDPTSIDRLDQFAGLWSWFENGPLDLEVWIAGKRFLNGQIDANAKENKGYFNQLRRVTHALATFVDKEMRPPNMTFALSEFGDISTALGFIQLQEGTGLTVNMRLTAGTFPDIRSYVTPLFLEFGGYLFFSVARYIVKGTTASGEDVTMDLSDPVIQRKSILVGTLADNAEFARDETRAVERLCAKDGEEVAMSFEPAMIALDPDSEKD